MPHVVHFPRSVIVANTTQLEVAEGHLARGQAAYRDSNYSVAAYWHRQAAELGHPQAQFALASIHYDEECGLHDDAAAARWFEKAANSGIVEAGILLGNMHEHGNGVPLDLFAAERLYRRAASQGNTAAAFMLGRLLERARDTPSSSSDECDDEYVGDCEEECDEDYEECSFYVPQAQCDYATQRQSSIEEAKRKRRFDLYGI